MIELADIQHGAGSLKALLIFMLNHDGRGLMRTLIASAVVFVFAVISFPRVSNFRYSGLLLLLVFPFLWIAQSMMGGIFARQPGSDVSEFLLKMPFGLLVAYGVFWLYCHVKLDKAGWFVFVIMAANLPFMLLATLFALMQISGDAI